MISRRASALREKFKQKNISKSRWNNPECKKFKQKTKILSVNIINKLKYCIDQSAYFTV